MVDALRNVAKKASKDRGAQRSRAAFDETLCGRAHVISNICCGSPALKHKSFVCCV